MASHHDLISGLVHEEREVSGEWNTVSVGNQDSEWIRPHESEGGRAIFLAVEFRYVHFPLSEWWLGNAGEGARATRLGLLRHCDALAVDCIEDRISPALE